MTVQASPAEPFLIARAFDAPVDTVWAAWTRPAAFTRWFGPAGTTTRIVTFDLRPGGMLHSVMQTPVGSMGAKFVYRTVEPPTRLVWEHSFADEHGAIVRAPFSPSWPLRLLTTVTFAPQDARTLVTLTWTTLEATDAEQQTFDAAKPSMTGGWTGSFDQLAAYLAAGQAGGD